MTDEGTSTTALSVSSSITGWPSETRAPDGDHHAHQVPLIDVFAEFGKNELRGGSGVVARTALAGAGFAGARLERALRAPAGCAPQAEFWAAGWLGFRGGFGFGRFRGTRAIFEGEDDLADFEFVAFFYTNLFYVPVTEEGHFDDRFVGLKFHHGLAFGDAGAGRDHQSHQVTAFDIFAQLGKFKFRHSLSVPFLAVDRV